MDQILVLNDYINDSKVYYYFIDDNDYKLNKVELDFENKIEYGIFNFNAKNKEKTKYIFQSRNLYMFINGGIYYSTNVPVTLLLYKKNLDIFKNINVMTSITSMLSIENKNIDYNNIYKNKIGFDIEDYNFYTNDYFYDYYTTKNVNAYKCVKLSVITTFMWNIIYKLVSYYRISFDFDLYNIFYKMIYENLTSDFKPILSSNINHYFKKYHANFIDPNFDNIIESWINLINGETDLVTLLIYMQSSYILSIDELLNAKYDKLFTTLNHHDVENKFKESCQKIYGNDSTVIHYGSYYKDRVYPNNRMREKIQIINKNIDFLNSYTLIKNIGTRNCGLYVNNKRVLLSRNNIDINLIQKYINLNRTTDIFPQLFNVYFIENKYYFESHKLDFDLLQVFNKVIPEKVLKIMNIDNLSQEKIMNIFAFKNRKKNMIEYAKLLLYINHVEKYNDKYNKYYKYNEADFNIIEKTIKLFKDNEVNAILYRKFMELLTYYYEQEFINIIKEIALLELKLLKMGYFCHDFHKLENFGCKLINGLNKFYIIDWEYLEAFKGNAFNSGNVKKMVKLLNTRVINENETINFSIFPQGINSNLLLTIGLNNNILELIYYEHAFRDKTPILKENITFEDIDNFVNIK